MSLVLSERSDKGIGVEPIERHEFWQKLYPASDYTPPPFGTQFPAQLPDGRVLYLPIRPLADTGNGIASLILNQSSFAVEAALADVLAEKLAESDPDVVVGLPTLGLSLAKLVAQRLGHERFVALGTSRKFWYDEALSVPMSSITSPQGQKRLYIDPRVLPLLQGARVCLIDDVISSGTSICAGLDVLGKIGITPVSIGAAMLQTRRWIERLDQSTPSAASIVKGVIQTPLLSKGEDGWLPEI